jgi:hypothetical protein
VPTTVRLMIAQDEKWIRQMQLGTGQRPPKDDPFWERMESLGLAHREEVRNAQGVVVMRGPWRLTTAGLAYSAT